MAFDAVAPDAEGSKQLVVDGAKSLFLDSGDMQEQSVSLDDLMDRVCTEIGPSLRYSGSLEDPGTPDSGLLHHQTTVESILPLETVPPPKEVELLLPDEEAAAIVGSRGSVLLADRHAEHGFKLKTHWLKAWKRQHISVSSSLL